ncbi:MAG: hypothetical protein LIO65_02505, partial [Odoribacter sp.]|nr:hypothetical protein [Odoribacter sp.]
LYVDSEIIQNEEIIGATVKYVHRDVSTYGLPKFNTNVGTMNAFDYYLTLDLPTADCEYEFIEGANIFEHEKEDDKLIITLLQHVKNDNFGIYIRVKDSYTYVYGRVE